MVSRGTAGEQEISSSYILFARKCHGSQAKKVRITMKMNLHFHLWKDLCIDSAQYTLGFNLFQARSRVAPKVTSRHSINPLSRGFAAQANCC